MSEAFVERPRYLCALGGATAAVTALPGGVPVLHAAPGCAGNFAWTWNGGSGLQVGGYCGALTVPSSNMQEHEVVFGGEERLREQLRNTIQVVDGELYVVISGCVPEIIGDDLQAVVGEFRDDGVTIVGAETGGFKGNSYHGYDLVLAALARDFIPQAAAKVAGQVNLFGIAPGMDPFWRGNLEGIRTLLEGLGLKVNSFFTSADTLEGIRAAGSAELNIVVSDLYGREAARLFAERHAIPAVTTPLPIGPSATSDFLRQVGAALGLEAAAEALIVAETARYYQVLEPLTDCWNDLDLQRYAVVVGDANYAPALTRFLASDLGWLPELTVCTDPLSEVDQALLVQHLDDLAPDFSTQLVFETDGSEVLGHLNRHWLPSSGSKYHHAFSPAFVVGSSLDRELAQALGAAHLAVSFPVANRAVLDRGYTGYRGGLRLIEDLVSAIVAGR